MAGAACTIRLYDPDADEWSLHWVSSRRTDIDPPVVGRFGDDGRGEFYADDTYDGQPIKVRYVWSDVHADGARWEQAFSTDGGKTWEVNWSMEHVRARMITFASGIRASRGLRTVARCGNR